MNVFILSVCLILVNRGWHDDCNSLFFFSIYFTFWYTTQGFLSNCQPDIVSYISCQYSWHIYFVTVTCVAFW